MKKQPTKIKKRVIAYPYFEMENSIDSIMEQLTSLKKELTDKGFTNLTLDRKYGSHYDYDGYDIVVMGDRLETDEEFQSRLDFLKKVKENNKKSAKDKKDAEYKTFLKLQKKFEKHKK